MLGNITLKCCLQPEAEARQQISAPLIFGAGRAAILSPVCRTVRKQHVLVVINAAHKITEKGYFKKQATAIVVRMLVNLPLAIIFIISL